LKKIQIYTGRYKQAFRLQIRNSRIFTQGFPVKGGGEYVNNGIAMTSTPGKGMLAEPGELNLSYGPDFEHVSIFMEPGALSGTLAGLIGAPADHELKLDRSGDDLRSDARLSRRLIKLLVEEFADEASGVSPLLSAELEQTILVAFLYGNRSNYSRLLEDQPARVAPWQIRRVEEYIEANWDQPIAIEALAIVANASARSIFHSFREQGRLSPMKFVKQVRLRRAREMLVKPALHTTVTSTACACGFGNLGHFASDYHRVFGETPSATLSRAKGQQPS
jgi:AraC-like DNA-binding protein